MDKEALLCSGRDWIDLSEINTNAIDCNGREIGVRWTKSLSGVMGERLE